MCADQERTASRAPAEASTTPHAMDNGLAYCHTNATVIPKTRKPRTLLTAHHRTFGRKTFGPRFGVASPGVSLATSATLCGRGGKKSDHCRNFSTALNTAVSAMRTRTPPPNKVCMDEACPSTNAPNPMEGTAMAMRDHHASDSFFFPISAVSPAAALST